MVKMVVILKRPPTMTADELRKWWLGSHADMGKKLPGLRKYVVSLTSTTPGGKEPPYDGISELWFDSMEALQQAQTSPIMKEAGKDTMEHKMNMTMLITEEFEIKIPSS